MAVPKLKPFKIRFRKNIQKILKNLREERKAIRQFIRVKSSSDFLKARINSIKLLINNGWDVTIKKLQLLKKAVNKSSSFDDFYSWRDQTDDILFEIEDFRNDYREMLVLINSQV